MLRRALQEAQEQRQMQQVPLPRAVLPGPVSGLAIILRAIQTLTVSPAEQAIVQAYCISYVR